MNREKIVYEYKRKDRRRRDWRDADGPARQQTRRAKEIHRGVSCLGGTARDGRRRLDEKGFRQSGPGGDLYYQSLATVLARRGRCDSRYHAKRFTRRR